MIKTIYRKAVALAMFVTVLLTAAMNAHAQPYNYYPSTFVNKMISMSGTPSNGPSEASRKFLIGIAPGQTQLQIGIFDGDISLAITALAGHWDVRPNDGTTIDMKFTLYADPLHNGSTTTQLAQWSSLDMLDNDWYNQVMSNSPAAKNANGIYYYCLEATHPDISKSISNTFRLRSNGTIKVQSGIHVLGVPLGSNGDAQIIYTSLPAYTPTIYDGSWNLNFYVPPSLTAVNIWDGEFDYGSTVSGTLDVDDANTPNTIPSFNTFSNFLAESAVGLGAPQDDNLANSGYYQRSPSVYYNVVSPNSDSYTNNNPSGSLEWELFKISTSPFDPTDMDYTAATIPSGIWSLNILGLDLNNVFTLYMPDLVLLAVDENEDPVMPNILAGNVFNDVNGLTDNTVNGTGNNNGGNFYVHLVSGSTVVATAPVNSDGSYHFMGIDAGDYSVVLNQSSTPSATPSVPSGVTNTGENLGAAAGNDGTADGVLTGITIGINDIVEANFGVNGASLPVMFGNVSATYSNGMLLVNWRTETEINNSYFDVEISTDGKTFKKVQTIQSKAQNGFSTTPINYEHTVSANTLAALLAVPSILGLLLLSVSPKSRKRYWILKSVLAIILISSIGFACSKDEKAMDAKSAQKIFVRIAQVDKDGKKAYSKVIQATNE